MTLITLNPDKFIDNLFALPKEKELREGVFSAKLQDGDSPGVVITLTIHAPERPVLPSTEREAPQEASPIRTFQTTSYFLQECHTKLFASNPHYERQLLISGASFPNDSHMLDILIEPHLANVSAAGVEADLGDLFANLANLDIDHGLLLTGIFHSHLWKGRSAVNPSATDRRLQENLEKSGYKTVQGIFSEDGFCGLFTNTVPFALKIIGTGVEEVETHAHQTVVRLTQTPHLSHQTLQTPQPAGGRFQRSPGSYPRI